MGFRYMQPNANTMYYGKVCYESEADVLVPTDALRIAVHGKFDSEDNDRRVPMSFVEIKAELPGIEEHEHSDHQTAVYLLEHKYEQAVAISGGGAKLARELPAENAARRAGVREVLAHRLQVDRIEDIPGAQITDIFCMMDIDTLPGWFRSHHPMLTRLSTRQSTTSIVEPTPPTPQTSVKPVGGELVCKKRQQPSQPQAAKTQRARKQQKGVWRTDCFNNSSTGTVMLLGGMNGPSSGRCKEGLGQRAMSIVSAGAINESSPLLIIRVLGHNAAEVVESFQRKLATERTSWPKKRLTIVTYFQAHGADGKLFNLSFMGSNGTDYTGSPLVLGPPEGMGVVSVVKSIDAALHPVLQMYMVCGFLSRLEDQDALRGRPVVGYTGLAAEGTHAPMGALNPIAYMVVVAST